MKNNSFLTSLSKDLVRDVRDLMAGNSSVEAPLEELGEAAKVLSDKQKKLDKNHNNKLDADDFRRLRGEGIDRVVIHSPYTPDIHGGLAEVTHRDLRTGIVTVMFENMYYKLKKGQFTELPENFEQLDELSKKTLGSYVKKAANSMAQSHAEVEKARADRNAAHAIDYATTGTPSDVRQKVKDIISNDASKREKTHFKDVVKRHTGINKAADKLTKEEVEDLDEAKKKHQYIEVVNKYTGGITKHKVHPDKAFAALNHFRSDMHTKSARIVHEDLEETFEIYDLTELNEGAGTLKGLPKHMIKTIVHSVHGGENSPVEEHGRSPNHSHLRTTLSKAMSSGDVSVVHVNGKPVSAVHISSPDSRPKYGVGDETSNRSITRTQQQHNTGKYDSRTKKYIPAKYHDYQSPHHSKEEALHRVMNAIEKHTGDLTDKATYKKHNIEIKSYKRDPKRAEVSANRTKNKPNMQSNYVNYAPGEARPAYSTVKKTSSTPAGDMSGIKSKALDKMADKHVVDNSSPKTKAEELHAALGKAIASGDTRQAKSHMDALDQHVRQKGIGSESPTRSRYKDAVKDLRDRGGYSKDYARSSIKDMKAGGKIKEDIELSQDEIDMIEASLADLDEGRGRPPKEGSAAWKLRQTQAAEDVPALGIQLRKAASINKPVTFANGESKEIHRNHIDRFNDHMDARKTSQEKANFQKTANKSHADFVKAVTADIPHRTKDTGEIVKYGR